MAQAACQTKNCPSATLCTTNPTWARAQASTKRPATSRLSHGTALICILKYITMATKSLSSFFAAVNFKLTLFILSFHILSLAIVHCLARRSFYDLRTKQVKSSYLLQEFDVRSTHTHFKVRCTLMLHRSIMNTLVSAAYFSME
jgi:hypothetical protein